MTTYLGETTGRKRVRFGIKDEDRFTHLWLLGATGVGKTSLLEDMAIQDFATGHSVIYLDPHGDSIATLLNRISIKRLDDLIYLDLSASTQRYSYNPLKRVRYDLIPLVVSNLIDTFQKLFDDAWGSRLEGVLRAALYALIEYGEAKLPDILRILVDDEWRKAVGKSLKNDYVRNYWLWEYPSYNPRFRQELIAPIQTKVGAFLADPRLFQLFTGNGIELRIRAIMDDGKILLVNLAKGSVGSDSARVLGAMLLTTITSAAFSRTDTPVGERKSVYLFADEFHNAATVTFSSMVSELRKYRVAVTLANQHTTQLDTEVCDAVLHNVGTQIIFRVGHGDAKLFSGAFAPDVEARHLMNLPNREAIIRLMIDGTPATAFPMKTLDVSPLLDKKRHQIGG